MHHAVCGTLLAYLGVQRLDEKNRWYFHDLRRLLQSLLANPASRDKDAEEIATRLDEVNQMSHSVMGGT